jgi:hypothetical protein
MEQRYSSTFSYLDSSWRLLVYVMLQLASPRRKGPLSHCVRDWMGTRPGMGAEKGKVSYKTPWSESASEYTDRATAACRRSDCQL